MGEGTSPVSKSVAKGASVDSRQWDLSEKAEEKASHPDAGSTMPAPLASREVLSETARADYLPGAIENVQVKLEPDLVRVVDASELCTQHTLSNCGEMAIVFRVKVTNPRSFRVHPVFGKVAPKASATLKITRLAKVTPKSDRFDVEILPLAVDGVPEEKWADKNAKTLPEDVRSYSCFAHNYRPVVRQIRFRATAPWTRFLQDVSDPATYQLGPEMQAVCKRAGIQMNEGRISLNDFSLLWLAMNAK